MTPESLDYRLYLEDNFKRIDDHFESQRKLIDAQFENVHDKLDSIEEQVKKTNNRVTHLEDDVKIHPIICPNAKEIVLLESEVKLVKDGLLEYNFFKKYPKTAVLILGFALIMMVLGTYQIILKIQSDRKTIDRDIVIERIDDNTK